MADSEPDLKATIRAEGEPGSLVAVVELTCPDCQRRLEFRAQDEGPDGRLTCPHCGQRIVVGGEGFAGAQRVVDSANRQIRSLLETNKDLNRTLSESLRRFR